MAESAGHSNEKRVRALEELVPDEPGIMEFESRLKQNILRMPGEIEEASGIVINGRRIKSLLFTTDVALIHNCDADAIFAVYPFTAHRAISSSIIAMASRPVFCGVGGQITQGMRAIYLANDAESQGATGVVVNVGFPNGDLRRVAQLIDIPVVVTVVSGNKSHVGARLRNGASILNVAGGRDTVKLVTKIRKDFPSVPIIASGGPSSESILATIEAGANAIIYTPPSSQELVGVVMDEYRRKA